MAKNSITDYSKTASLNTDIQSVDIDEGCLPSGINNAIRELMADLAAMNDGTVSLTSPSFAAATITGDLTVDTNTLYVDSTNNRVGIGTSSPSTNLHVSKSSVSGTSYDSNDLLTLENNGFTAINMISSASLASTLIFSDTTRAVGFLQYNHSDNSLRSNVNGSERLRIDSSGNLLVGKTSTSSATTTVGFHVQPSGVAVLTRDGGAPLRVSRKTSDGEVISIHKDGTTVGSIGVEGGDNFYITDSNNTGLNMKSGLIIPCNTNGSTRDNAIDLGASGGRFKDLYLSGRARAGGSTGFPAFSHHTDTDTGMNPDGSGNIQFTTQGSERMRITSSGRVGIGESNPDGLLHLTGDTNANGAEMYLQVNNNNTTDNLGAIHFGNNVDSTLSKILSGTAGANNSSYLTFSTSSAGSQSERMRIDASGNVLVGTTASNIYDNSGSGGGFVSTSGWNAMNGVNDAALYLNRVASDGVIQYFFQDGSIEGNISVSGTTVSYNGGHLARWSQLTDGTKDETIVKGTVMTNLDQMAVWSHDAVEAKDAYTEDNEQLNCMAVSSVEGDPNVAGVFVNWDNDDDQFNDMNIAMTGDMVIRIAQGTTVARGDLLMSAGDGTAKPQGDDIVRSKTIAKVTSINVSHTYDDGSYLVPCVLMAC